MRESSSQPAPQGIVAAKVHKIVPIVGTMFVTTIVARRVATRVGE
jgi:hypothetical protein